MFKMKSLALALACLLSLSAWSLADAPKQTRVACVGDSITHGSGTKNLKTDAYPAQLAKLLGDAYKVENFGVGGATLLNNGDKPYQKQNLYTAAIDSKPDVVVIMLGTNDTKPQNWKHKDNFVADYKQLIGKFQALPTHPRVFVCLPPRVPGKGNYGINDAGVQEEMPMIRDLAKETGCTVIDNYTPLKDHPELLPDRVHPNTEGAAILAKTVSEALLARQPAASK